MLSSAWTPRSTVGSIEPKPAASKASSAKAVGDGSVGASAVCHVFWPSVIFPGSNPQPPVLSCMARNRTRSDRICISIWFTRSLALVFTFISSWEGRPSFWAIRSATET